MKLEELNIRAPRSWDAPDTGYRGTIKFTSSSGAVELKLTNDVSLRLLAVVADLVVESSRTIARDLTSETITAAGPAIAHDK
jgi:hypothetical protein